MNSILPHIDYVLRNFADWIPAIDHVNVEYIAVKSPDGWILSSANVILGPTRLAEKVNDVVATDEIRVGQIRVRLTTKKLDDFLKELQCGRLNLGNIDYRFVEGTPISVYSPSVYQQSDYSIPHLEIRADQTYNFSQHINFAAINSQLRTLNKPFDGLADLLSYYSFSRDGSFPNEQKISVLVRAPADFMLDGCILSGNRLRIRIGRKSKYNKEKLSLGIRQFPNPNLSRRAQVADQLRWSRGKDGLEFGVLEIDLQDCTTVELMLSAGGFSVQQVFVSDKTKSLNPRLAIYRRFDPDLQQLREFLDPHPKKSKNLEQGVATLFYLLGAICSNPPATDAPDIILETRSGRQVIVECTVQINDMREKASKLLNRRHTLTFNEDGSGPTHDVLAILVVSSPRNKIPLEDDFLARNQILLATRENIDRAMNNLEFPPDLDSLFLNTIESMKQQMAAALGMGGGTAIA